MIFTFGEGTGGGKIDFMKTLSLQKADEETEIADNALYQIAHIFNGAETGYIIPKDSNKWEKLKNGKADVNVQSVGDYLIRVKNTESSEVFEIDSDTVVDFGGNSISVLLNSCPLPDNVLFDDGIINKKITGGFSLYPTYPTGGYAGTKDISKSHCEITNKTHYSSNTFEYNCLGLWSDENGYTCSALSTKPINLSGYTNLNIEVRYATIQGNTLARIIPVIVKDNIANYDSKIGSSYLSARTSLGTEVRTFNTTDSCYIGFCIYGYSTRAEAYIKKIWLS